MIVIAPSLGRAHTYSAPRRARAGVDSIRRDLEGGARRVARWSVLLLLLAACRQETDPPKQPVLAFDSDRAPTLGWFSDGDYQGWTSSWRIHVDEEARKAAAVAFLVWCDELVAGVPAGEQEAVLLRRHAALVEAALPSVEERSTEHVHWDSGRWGLERIVELSDGTRSTSRLSGVHGPIRRHRQFSGLEGEAVAPTDEALFRAGLEGGLMYFDRGVRSAQLLLDHLWSEGKVEHFRDGRESMWLARVDSDSSCWVGLLNTLRVAELEPGNGAGLCRGSLSAWLHYKDGDLTFSITWLNADGSPALTETLEWDGRLPTSYVRECQLVGSRTSFSYSHACLRSVKPRR